MIVDFLIKTSIVAIPVLLGSILGYRQYLIKREHEQVIKRYLEDGLDLIAQNIEHALSIYKENFKKSLRILKIFRETQKIGIKMDRREYSDEFKRYNIEAFYLTPFYKLTKLIGKEGKIFWDAAQELFAFVDITRGFYQDELCTVIGEYIEGNKMNTTPDKICKEFSNKIAKYNYESYKYYSILGELQNIIWILETQHIAFKKLKNFKDKPEIKECVDRLKEKFNHLENETQ